MSQVLTQINYQSIKDFINQEIARRDNTSESSPHVPSKYWQDFNKLAGYVRRLADEDLKYIRYHSWHLTSDNYLPYYFFPERAAGLIEEYFYIANLLDGFKPCESEEGLGYKTEYGKVSVDLLRYMRVLSDLYTAKKINRQDHLNILEIGGGYGQLAKVLLGFNPKFTYVLCDLEETLFFQAVHLSNELGPDRVRFLTTEGSPDKLSEGVVYLVPQSQAAVLEQYTFDLAINQQSMQEMNQEQVDRYCNLIKKTTKYFYSCNLDQHIDSIVDRTDIVKNLNDYLASKFTVEWSSKKTKGKESAEAYQIPAAETCKPSTFTKLQRLLFATPADFKKTNVEQIIESKDHDTVFGDYQVPRMILRV